MKQILLESIGTEWDNLLRLAPRVILAVAFFTFAVVVGRLLARGIGKVLDRSGLSATQKKFFRRLTVWLVAILGLAVALNIIGLKSAASGLLAGGGITAVVLGFAFREIGENFLAGLLLAFSRPFKLGDIIESGEFKGTVRSIEIRHTHIRTGDGRDVFVPNAQIINSPLVNFTRDGLLRPAFQLGIDYGDDAREACRLLRDTTAGVSGVADDPAPSAVITGLDSSWVTLEVAFWIDTFAPGVSLAAVRTEVMDACRRTLREAGFTFSTDVGSNVAVRLPEGVDLRGAEPSESAT